MLMSCWRDTGFHSLLQPGNPRLRPCDFSTSFPLNPGFLSTKAHHDKIVLCPPFTHLAGRHQACPRRPPTNLSCLKSVPSLSLKATPGCCPERSSLTTSDQLCHSYKNGAQSLRGAAGRSVKGRWEPAFTPSIRICGISLCAMRCSQDWGHSSELDQHKAAAVESFPIFLWWPEQEKSEIER